VRALTISVEHPKATGMTSGPRPPSPLLRRNQIAVAAVLQVLGLLLVYAYVAPAAEAAEHRFRPVQVTKRTATFAVDDLVGMSVLSARVTARGGKSRGVAVASVRRATLSSIRRLRVRLPSSWRPARGSRRLRVTLRVRARPKFGSIVWKADAESMLASEWASSSSEPEATSPPNPDRSRIAKSTFRAQGQHSYRFEMRDGDDSYGARAELGQAMPALGRYHDRWFRAGEERWIAMQYYVPPTWGSMSLWQTIFQIKPVSPGGGGPNIGIAADNDRLRFYGSNNTWGSTAGDLNYGSGPLDDGAWPLTKGRWIKLTFHVVFSADPDVGRLEVLGDLADGQGMKTLVPPRSTATMKYLDGGMDPAQLRVGIYRNRAITATQSLYVDGVTVATTRATAEADAYAR